MAGLKSNSYSLTTAMLLAMVTVVNANWEACASERNDVIFRASWTPRFSEEHGGLSEERTGPIVGIQCSGNYCDDKRLLQAWTSVCDSGVVAWSNWAEGQAVHAVCGVNQYVSRMQCRGSHCSDMRVECRSIDLTKCQLQRRRSSFLDSENDQAIFNQDIGFDVLAGVVCNGGKCGTPYLEVAKLSLRERSIFSPLAGVCPDNWEVCSSSVFSGTSWTPWFSEEHGGLSEERTGPISALECSRNYCDNKRLLQAETSVCDSGVAEWTEWISEEDQGLFRNRGCGGKNSYVSRIQCKDSRCDKIRLECRRIDETKCVMDQYNSDSLEVFENSEDKPASFGPGEVMTGLSCVDSFCSRIFVEKKTLELLPPVCATGHFWDAAKCTCTACDGCEAGTRRFGCGGASPGFCEGVVSFCQSNPCDPNAACADFQDSSNGTCSCNTGYIGDGRTCIPAPESEVSANLTNVTRSDKCFVVPKDATGSWEQARTGCSSIGGSLATIASEQENAAIFALWIKNSFGNDKDARGGMWIGANDIAIENHFVWVDGSAVSFTAWANVYGAQQPNNWKGQNCVSFGYKANAGAYEDHNPVAGWVDNDCTLEQPYVCQIPCTETTSPTSTTAPTTSSSTITTTSSSTTPPPS